jgi:hypothetical protein
MRPVYRKESHNTHPTPATRERRAQIRGLLYLALAAIAFSILRATLHSGLHSVFNRGWWRLW